MKEHKPELFVLGGNGFVGRAVVQEALARGFRVKTLVRDRARASELASAGAVLIQGDAASPEEWIGEVANSKVLIDLVQPELHSRIGLTQIRKIAILRVTDTRRLLAALESIPPEERPLLMSVSGLDDLIPDAEGRVGDDSPLRDSPIGFGHVGVPVRRVIERSGLACTYIYLATVYGPGKAFAKRIFPQLAAGTFRIAGSGRNRMPLVHLEDAARALVHIAEQPQDRLSGRSHVIADGSEATLRDFAGSAAELLGAPPPRTVPLWLGRLVLGRILCETVTRDIGASPAALLRSGFQFRYRSCAEGLPSVLQQLGYGSPGARQNLQASAPNRRFPFWLQSAVTVGALLAENLFDFPLSVPRMKHLAGGLPLLDMRPWYSFQDAYQLFGALGAQGRSAYVHLLWSVDLCLPFLFALFLSRAIKRGRFSRLWWMPALGAASDYAENTAITVLLLRYPNRVPALVLLAAALTSLKWVGYLTSLALAVVGYGMRKSGAPAGEPFPTSA